MLSNEIILSMQSFYIASIMEKYKVTQKQIASSIGVSRNSISAYYNERAIMGLDVFLKLSFEYGFSSDLMLSPVKLGIGMRLVDSIMEIMEEMGL